jgi:hypothetical protein
LLIFFTSYRRVCSTKGIIIITYLPVLFANKTNCLANTPKLLIVSV